MAFQSLYRRYRPQRFAEVRGQEHLVKALQNAVRTDSVGHAYLFSGPRGTGKTSTARILAKALNCEHQTDGEPCGVCESCVAIQNGTSFDVHELDAASNNKVEDIRELVSKAALGTPGRTKVYILDEVHMLTSAASNALLKTLEEPPEHVVFVLATTDPHKVLPTIKSRTQPYEVHLLSADELKSLAEYIVEDADLDVSPRAIDYVVRASGGSARDMESLLDQVVAAGGIPQDTDVLDDLVAGLCDRDTARVLIAVDKAINGGRNARTLGEDLIGRLRDVFLAAVGADLSRLPDADRDRVRAQAEGLTAAGATRALEVLGEAFVGIQDAPDQRVTLEVALVRLTRPDAELSLSALADRVSRLERAEPAARTPAPATTAPTPAAPPPAARTTAAEAEPREPVDEPVADAPAAGAPGARPADRARQTLRERTSPAAEPARSAPKRRGSGSSPSKAPATAKNDAPPSATTSPATTAPEPQPERAATSTAELPSRDELTIAWGDAILPNLGRAKPRFASGRWIDVDETGAVFGLPNKIHASKCEEMRADVERVLADHFGRAVPIRIVVDGDAIPPRDSATPSPPAPEIDDSEHDIDPSELADATDVATNGVDRVREMFPGAELVQTEDDPQP